jgi:carboxypeptidase family protein
LSLADRAAAVAGGVSAGSGAKPPRRLVPSRGTVADETGGALPGVTLTLSSPALQVAQLTATSDVQGRYRFSDLRDGVYKVVAELQGFQGVIRENVELSVGFVARIDITLKVGSVSETITVSGASPVVDVTTEYRWSNQAGQMVVLPDRPQTQERAHDRRLCSQSGA